MNTAVQGKSSQNSNDQVPDLKNKSNVQTGSASISKEREVMPISGGSETAREISSEIEVPKEVERAGVMKVSETIELPPDIKKLGVTPSGSSVPVSASQTLPKIVLPISDQQVVTGLHISITSALKWLSIWCIRKLQKAHIALKVIHGKIIRVRT